MEDFLRDSAKLSPARRQAINDARHQIAREMWQRDQKLALDIAQQIRNSDPSFCPSEGPASPQSYRLVYRMLGFRGAQWVADSKRSVVSQFRVALFDARCARRNSYRPRLCDCPNSGPAGCSASDIDVSADAESVSRRSLLSSTLRTMLRHKKPLKPSLDKKICRRGR